MLQSESVEHLGDVGKRLLRQVDAKRFVPDGGAPVRGQGRPGHRVGSSGRDLMDGDRVQQSYFLGSHDRGVRVAQAALAHRVDAPSVD